MATVTKDFKIKYGLIVEGSTATVNNYSILTKSPTDEAYIIGLIGGTATALNTPNTVVKRDGSGNFAAGTITANLTGDVTGTVSDISNHSTDNLAEGTNSLYFTSERVRNILTGATKTNISITDVAGVLHITAENGVADSTTDDLTEGTTRLYFTNQRALDATSSAYDAAGAATTAENNAKSYADGLASNYDPAGAATTAENNAKSYADGLAVNYDAAGAAATAKSEAIAAAALDATSKANTAESNANDYTDGEITTALSTAQGYADTAEANANAYTDNAVSGLNWKQAVNLLYDAAIPVLSGSGATQLVVDGHAALGDADSGYRLLLTGVTNPGIYVYNSTGGSWTLTRSDDADTYTELIGASVYVMEGTQYGSTSWVQSNHYITDFTGQSWTQFSGQGSVTAGSGITVNGLEVSVNRTTVDTWYDASGAAAIAQSNAEDYADGLAVNYDAAGSATTAENNAKSYADGLAVNYDPAGAATTAENNAKSYADGLATNYDPAGSATTAYNDAVSYANGLATNYDPAGSATTAYNNAVSYADSLTTDDVAEGTFNHYYTDERAQTAAADLLTSAIKSNITITGTGAGLTITAENGVAGSTTDDLVEGLTNLYFQDSRAVDAITNATIYPTVVDINDYRREEATQQYVATASTVTAHTFTGNKSVKYLVRVVGNVSGTLHSQLTELVATVDGNNNVHLTEYGSVHTTEPALATFTVDYATGEFRLRATTANNGMEVIVAATLLSWAD